MMRETKKYKKRGGKRTRKYYGGQATPVLSNNGNNNNHPSELKSIQQKGIVTLGEDKLSNMAGEVGDYVKSKALRLFGLQEIHPSQMQNVSTPASQLLDKSSSVASKLATDVVNVADKTSSAIVQNVNDVLRSPQVNQSLQESLQNTKEIAKDLLQTVNQSLNDPIVKQEFAIAMDNVSDYAKIAVDSLDEPLNDSIDMLNKAGQKALQGASTGMVKVVGDAVGAVPFVGPVVDIGKVVNDGSKAVASVIEAGSEAAEATSLLIGKTSENLKKAIQELDRKKQEAQSIMNRTNNSINQFRNNMPTTPRFQNNMAQNNMAQNNMAQNNMAQNYRGGRRLRETKKIHRRGYSYGKKKTYTKRNF
jgi:hypothetical protein